MQEGVLAKTLLFQFENLAIDYAFLDDRILQQIPLTTDETVLLGNKASLIVSHLITMRDSEISRENLFSSLWFNMRHRATSRLSDQAVCASILCDVDLRPVLAADNEDRMEVFWRTCREIPLGILWVNGPRFDLDTMRWAPKSFLHPSTWALPPPKTGATATVMDDGLHFSGVNAFYFQAVDLPSTENSMIEFHVGDDATTYVMLMTRNVDNPDWTTLRPFWNSVCLLWHELPSPSDFSHGVLVSCSGLEEQELCAGPSQNGGIRGRWLAQVNLFAKGGEWAAHVSTLATQYSDDGEPLPPQALNVSVHPSRPHTISAVREWCIY
jgi:hypothetical protein